jgi:D-alanyl-D-alanine endopeptidase (penicillin-binding protein 7)
MASGNDCAEALAGAYPGGKEKFIEAMNKKAQSIGTRRTVFHSPSGLDTKNVGEEEGSKNVQVTSNVSTAREIARIARLAFADDTIRSICLKRAYAMEGKDGHSYPVRNTNKLLRDNLPINGGKTGYTNNAGHCLVTQFAPGRNMFLIVVLGSPDHFRDTRLVYRKALEQTRTMGSRTETNRTTDHRTRSNKALGG